MFFESLVFLDREAGSKGELLSFLTQKLFEAGKVENAEAFLADVKKREELCPTGIGRGVAVPHGMAGARERATAFARLVKPLDWGDGESVGYVFLIAIPRDEKGDGYIEAIGRLSRFLLEEGSTAKLGQPRTESEALELLKGI